MSEGELALVYRSRVQDCRIYQKLPAAKTNIIFRAAVSISCHVQHNSCQMLFFYLPSGILVVWWSGVLLCCVYRRFLCSEAGFVPHSWEEIAERSMSAVCIDWVYGSVFDFSIHFCAVKRTTVYNDWLYTADTSKSWSETFLIPRLNTLKMCHLYGQYTFLWCWDLTFM